MSKKQKNVLGENLEECSMDPLTGWHRDGCCNTDENDHGLHTVCAKVSNEFLNWCKNQNISMAVCTNKQEHLSNDLLKKIGIYDYFEYVAGSDTFNYCKPDPRHLTSVVEILDGDIKKSLMIGDSETDSAAANSANLPFILLEDGYTDKKVNEIPHDHLVTNFQGIEKIVSKYLNT